MSQQVESRQVRVCTGQGEPTGEPTGRAPTGKEPSGTCVQVTVSQQVC